MTSRRAARTGRIAWATIAAIAIAGAALADPDRSAAAAPADPYPRAAAAYVVTVDGRVLWEHAADEARPPASLTKIMTALVLLEDPAWRPEAWVVASARAAAAGGARLGLRPGDAVRAGDLLAAMLVRSANDACAALVEHAAGSEARFVERMNARARDLGLAATRFANATGFDHAEHRASARDLARLTEAALGIPEFARTVALDRVEVTTRGGRRLAVTTSNALLGRLEGARGVKTGFTSRAGKCLAGLAERDGRRVLVILLDAPDRWWAADVLFEDAFEALARDRVGS